MPFAERVLYGDIAYRQGDIVTDHDSSAQPSTRSYGEELARFAEALTELRISCGSPSLRTLQQNAPRARPLSTAALSEAFNGRRLPRQDYLIAMVQTLLALDEGRPVQRTDSRLQPWRLRWQELERLRIKERPGRNPAPPEASEAASNARTTAASAAGPAGPGTDGPSPDGPGTDGPGPDGASRHDAANAADVADVGNAASAAQDRVLLAAEKEAESIRAVAAARAEELLVQAQAERDQAATERARLRSTIADELAAARDEARQQREQAAADAARIREEAEREASARLNAVSFPSAAPPSAAPESGNGAVDDDAISEKKPTEAEDARPEGPTDFSDIMDAFFGTTKRTPRSRARRGRDITVVLDIELSDVAFGATKDIELDTAVSCDTCQGGCAAPGTSVQWCDMCKGRGEVSEVTRSFLGQVMRSRPCPKCAGVGSVVPNPCPQCGGQGRVPSRRTLTVAIPSGTEDGARIQLRGEAQAGVCGGDAGDLNVEVHVLPHPFFERRDDDLHCTVTIPMTAAILGTKVPLETLDGLRNVEIQPGTQSLHSICLQGQGITRAEGDGRGDLFVHIEVRTPTRIDVEQEQLVRRLARLRGEEAPAGQFEPGEQGLFSRLKDAFNGR